MQLNRRCFVGLVAALAMWPVASVMADRDHGGHEEDEHDYEDAVRAQKSGDALPLRDILDEIGKSYKGEIVGIKFEKKKGVWIYEIKLVTPEGRYLEIYVDAKTSQILQVEGK